MFEGLKVLDCASFIAAPAAATILADFGADVIKIEPPGGDPYRKLPQIRGQPKSALNYAWMLTSRSKRSLALDLTKAEGQAVLYRLITDADVFITNMPPRVRERLGISHKQIAHLNSRLIYASFTGYGEVGEEANKPGFDSNAYWARSGLMSEVRPDADSAPARSVAGMGDHPAALALYGAIVTALYRREKTGKGGHVSSSLLANGLWSNGIPIQAKLCDATFTPRPRREHALNALSNHYKCRDGRWLMLSLLDENRQWPILAAALGRRELLGDPRFETAASRHSNAHDLVAIFDAAFVTHDFAEWRGVLDAAGLVFGLVATLDDAVDDKQARDNHFIVPIADGSALTIDSPIFIDEVIKRQPKPAPEVGASSDEILAEAGYLQSEITGLRRAGIVA